MEHYKKVETYTDLIKLNVDFINAKINWTPYHQKPLEHLGNLKEDLIETNRLGFLTLGGQCALDTPTEEKKLFLDGYLDPKLVRNFIKYLKKFKKIEYFIELPDKSIKTNIRNWHNVFNVRENQTVYYNSLSRTRNNTSEEWMNNDNIPFRDLTYITLNAWKGFDNILSILKDYAFIHIQHRSFHNKSNDLYTIINGYLKSDQRSYKPKKSKDKKQKNNFGSNLTELKRDLKLVQTQNSFGVKKFNTENIKRHIKEHKWKYFDALSKLALIGGIKYAWNQKNKTKDNKKKEEMMRKVIREELKDLNNLKK
jgi:hypothetical protein